MGNLERTLRDNHDEMAKFERGNIALTQRLNNFEIVLSKL